MPLAEDIAILAQAGNKGLAKDIIQALYDILGAYPRLNVLPYAYSFSLTAVQGTAIAANATVQTSIRVSADAAFIGTKITGASTADYAILQRMAGSDRILMNEAVHSAAWTGTAERPAILPKPLLVQPNSTISFDVTDLSGAQNEVYYSIIGFKVYNLQQYGPNQG